MKIKANSLLKIGVPLLLVVALVLGLRACHNRDDSASEDIADQVQDNTPRQLTEEERNALGVEADGPQDTVSTLVAQMHQMRDQLAASQEQSEQLREQNERLAEQKRNMEQTVSQALSEQRSHDAKQRQSLVDSLNDKIRRLRVTLDSQDSARDQRAGANRDSDPDMPVGLGLDGDTPGEATGGMTWVDPLEAGTRSAAADGDGDTAGRAFNTAFDSGKQAAQAAGERADDALPGSDRTADEGTPVYTVPKNSTLVGSVAMSALLGRVPIDGQVTDPYPFKVVIGRRNLTANGIELPELKSAVVSGTATGDWTLSCVRGQVKSITFVFQDGRVRTVPESDEPGDGNSGSDDDRIGYISNPAGVPCVSGQRKTNARSFILTNLLLSAGAAGANAYSGGETTTSVTGLGTTSGVTGNVGKYIAGSAASSGLNEVRGWLEKRFGQTFDAVYVPPGQRVAVNIDKELPIDYEHSGRKVRYEHQTRANSLD